MTVKSLNLRLLVLSFFKEDACLHYEISESNPSAVVGQRIRPPSANVALDAAI
jgi:hypothetical protein